MDLKSGALSQRPHSLPATAMSRCVLSPASWPVQPLRETHGAQRQQDVMAGTHHFGNDADLGQQPVRAVLVAAEAEALVQKTQKGSREGYEVALQDFFVAG